FLRLQPNCQEGLGLPPSKQRKLVVVATPFVLEDFEFGPCPGNKPALTAKIPIALASLALVASRSALVEATSVFTPPTSVFTPATSPFTALICCFCCSARRASAARCWRVIAAAREASSFLVIPTCWARVSSEASADCMRLVSSAICALLAA